MSFSFEIKTTDNDGVVLTTTSTISNVLKDVLLEQSAGDEREIVSGDLMLKHRDLFSYTWALPTRKVWFLVYYNSVLYDVFLLADSDEAVEESFDLETRLYQSKLVSIQAHFLNSIKQLVLNYETDTTLFNYALRQGIVSIDDVRVLNDSGAQLTKLDCYGFALGDTLAALAGKTSETGFTVRNVTLNSIPVQTADDLPILFRGDSYTIGITSLQDAILNTFYQNEDTDELYNLTWGDLFKMAVYGWNNFIKVTPVIDAGTLKIDLEFVPKTKMAHTGATTKTWSKIKRQQRHYKLDGLVLEGKNFKFIKRNPEGNVAKFEIPIANPDQQVDWQKRELYWVAGDAVGATNGGYQRYNILDGSSNNRPFGSESLIDAYYTEFFERGTTYSGELRFAGEKLFNKLTVPFYGGTETIQITKLQVDVTDEVAKVDGVVINP